jgi:hypothetical protein
MTAAAGRRCALIHGLLRALPAKPAGLGRLLPETGLAVMQIRRVQSPPACHRSVQHASNRR